MAPASVILEEGLGEITRLLFEDLQPQKPGSKT